MDDSISRQAAIDAVHKVMYEFFDLRDDDEESPLTEKENALLAINKKLTNRIKALPSAQPENIRCKDCMNWDTTWQNGWAKNYYYCPMIDRTCNGDWYCADAERRTYGSD